MKTLLKIGGIRVTSKNEYGEHEVRVAGRPNATYFTEDRDDAFGTAAHMAGFLEPLLHAERMMNKAKDGTQQETAFDFIYLRRHAEFPFTFRWNGANISLMDEDGEFIVLLNNDVVGSGDDGGIIAGILCSVALLIAGPGTKAKGEC